MCERYIDIMEKALGAYSEKRLSEIVDNAEKNGVCEHGFFRITSVMGILISKGRRKELMPLFLRAMDVSCEALWKTDMTIEENKSVGIDFAVKEIVFAYIEIEKSGIVKRERLEKWFDGIKNVDWRKNYSSVAKSETDPVNNWGMYNAAGEYMREYIGAANAEGYLDVQLASQLLAVDENGMYRDPGCPMLYDLASRTQFAVMLHFGYSGKWKNALDDALRKAGGLMLSLQSVNGEIPFGGRSNRFLFNEAYLAACCEFEAARYKREGNLRLAGEFKSAARLATESIEKRLSMSPIKHVRNAFPQNSIFGLEDYAYFDKYMVSLASFIYIAYLFAEDDIKEVPCPAVRGGFVLRTSESFHKIAASACGYSIEIDTNADLHYDATGLGRIQFSGAPSEMILSEPFPKKPSYSIVNCLSTGLFKRIHAEDENPSFLSLSPVVAFSDGTKMRIADLSDNVECKLDILQQSENNVSFDLIWKSPEFKGFSEIKESYVLSNSGVEIRASADLSENARLTRYIPVIETDGNDASSVSVTKSLVCVDYKGFKLKISGNEFFRVNKSFSNRDGIYNLLCCDGEYIRFSFS